MKSTSSNDRISWIIDVIFPNSSTGNLSAKNHIVNKTNYETVADMYNSVDDNDIPIIYNFMYKYIKQLDNKLPIVLSSDIAISSATIAGNAEKFIYTEQTKDHVNFLSKLKIVYFTSTPHLSMDLTEININNLSNSIISNLISNVDCTYTKHQLKLDPDQFILIGINENILNDMQIEELHKSNITHFTLKQIRKKGLNSILETIKDIVLDDPVHIAFNLSVMSYESTPMVNRFIKEISIDKLNGFNQKELTAILEYVKSFNIVGLDITGYDFRTTNTSNDLINTRAYRITCEVPQLILKHLANIKEKKINIFNENSKILIWRPLYQTSSDDIGWFILRNVSLDVREKLIQSTDDNIITFTVDDEDVYITSTTYSEQENMSYYAANNIYDCVLYPGEKMNLVFEMLNTAESSINISESTNTVESTTNTDKNEIVSPT